MNLHASDDDPPSYWRLIERLALVLVIFFLSGRMPLRDASIEQTFEGRFRGHVVAPSSDRCVYAERDDL